MLLARASILFPALILLLLAVPSCENDESTLTLETARSGVVVQMSVVSGNIIDLHDRFGQKWLSNASSWIEIGLDKETDLIACDRPSRARNDGDAITFEYDLRPRAPLTVRHSVRLVDVAAAVALERTIEVAPTDPPYSRDVRVVVSDPTATPNTKISTFVPHQDGFGEEVTGSQIANRHFVFAMSGRGLRPDGEAEKLAIPMMSESDESGHRLTRIADPFFTTSFEPAERKLGWIYRGRDVPLTEPESRTLHDVVQIGSPYEAMRAWYDAALPDVPKGPEWLHDIAWQHYDYMSHGGRGWFEDIDFLTDRLSADDRRRVLFTVHGWFDVYGRYTIDPTTRRLSDSWIVFPNAAKVDPKTFPVQTIPMTKAEVHRRIAYAKQRGFRVAFYFADGMASGEDVTALWAKDRTLYPGGWQGPDTTSLTWTLNPAHPAVYEYYQSYLDQLLNEYGQEIDALVWDETWTVRAGSIGTSPPSYADRAMMKLTKDLTLRVTQYRSELAFLTSDALGTPIQTGPLSDVPPYAIMGHGTYQDSWSHPVAWSYGIFPNFRNTLWSCNWSPQTYYEGTRLGVELVNAPVATSNGFGDNGGLARLTPEQQNRLLALFAKRKAAGKQQLDWRKSR